MKGFHMEEMLTNPGWGELWKQEEEIKKEYKEAGRRDEIKEVIKELHRNFHQTAPDMPLEYCYLSGVYTEKYLHDMRICQTFADEIGGVRCLSVE